MIEAVHTNFRTLDLNLLRVFDEVMAERSLTKAARNLSITQPAVSNALRRLRETLGDDLVRRAVIMALMCQGRVDIESIELAYLIDFRQYFAAEMRQLEPLVEMGLVQLESDGVRVTPLGWYFVRAIAMVFDRYLQADRTAGRFSRII